MEAAVRTRSGMVLVLAGLFAASGTYAQAQPTRAQQHEAEGLVAEGVRLRRESRNEEACALFERAHTLAPSPRTAGQLGFAEQRLQRWAAAERHLREALGSPTDEWVARNADALRASLAAVEGHAREAAPVTQSAPVPQREPAAAVAVVVREPTRDESPTRGRGLSPLVWIGGGVAVLAGGAALALWASGNGIATDYDAQCVDRAPTAGTDCAALRAETQETLDGRATGVNALWGVSIAGLVTAGVGVALSLRGGGERARVMVGARSVGVAVSW